MKALIMVKYNYRYTDESGGKCVIKQKFAAKALMKHPQNNRPLARIIATAPKVKLVGDGFYSTDNTNTKSILL